MNFVKMAIRRPVLVSVIFLMLVVLGLFSITKLNVTLLPDVNIPIVTIRTVYPGAGPDQIETLVTKPIEDALSTTNNLKNISSVSMEGISFVFGEFTMDVASEVAAADVREKVSAVKGNLPDDVKEPEILKLDLEAQPVLYVGFSGTDLRKVYELADDVVKPELQAVSGVGNIDLIGGLKREIRVDVSPDKLRNYRLDLVSVANRLRVENVNVPSGRFLRGDMEISGRLNSEFNTIGEISAVEIPIMSPATGKTRKVPLFSIAEVKDTYAEIRNMAKVDNKEAVALIIQKQPDANTIQVVDDLRKKIKRLDEMLPDGFELSVVADTSDFIRASVADVKSNLMMGIFITAFVLFLFLRSLGSTFIVTLTIPTALISTFFFMYLSGFTLNVLTLSSLALCVGILIDSSIVVLENIYRHRMELKEDAFIAAEKGALEVTTAVLASSLTNVVVFLPIAFLSGLVGQFFREFGMVQIFATLIALSVAFSMLPMLASRFLGGTGQIVSSQQKSERQFSRIRELYGSVLSRLLRKPLLVFGIVLILFIASLSLFPLIGSEFQPSTDQGISTIDVRMPPGTNLYKTEEATASIEKKIAEIPELERTYTTIGQVAGGLGSAGGQGTEYARILISWKDRRKRDARKIMSGLTPFLADIPGAVINVMENASGGREGGAPIQMYVTGPKWETVIPASQKILKMLLDTQGVSDADSSYHPGKPEINFVVKRERLSEFNISPEYVALNSRSALEGLVSTKLREGENEYDIRVTIPDSLKKDKSVLENIPLTNPMEELFLLKQVADIQETSGPTSKERFNRKPSVTIIGNVNKPLGNVMKEFRKEIKDFPLPPGVGIEMSGDIELMKDAFRDLGMALAMAIILVYLVMAAQFESWIDPFFVMGALPLAVIGILFGLFIFGKTVNMFSLLGVVILTGIGVNNGILIINFSKMLIARGKKPFDAIIEASKLRLRPCLMTMFTTIAATLPLAFGTGKASSFKSSMGVTIISGAFSSTTLTLFVLPVLYFLYTSRRKKKESN